MNGGRTLRHEVCRGAGRRLAGLNTQLTSCYFAATPGSTGSCNASGPTTRPGEEDLSDPMYRRTEENSQPMTRRNPADPRRAVAARSPCPQDHQNSEGGGHCRGSCPSPGEQQDRSKVGNTRLTALGRMSCPPAEPVQFLFNGKSRRRRISACAMAVSAARRRVRPWGRALRGPWRRGRRP